MNYKKLTLGITAVNALGILLVEIWSVRYADSNIDISTGWLIFIHLLSYYILVISSNQTKKNDRSKIEPIDCSHDWQPAIFRPREREYCVICNSERGKLN